MLKIKLARFGKRNQPHYRIVVNEARDKRDGSYVALLGHYAPTQTPKLLEIDTAAYQEWIEKGAQPTDTVANLYTRYTSKDPFPAKKPRPSKKAQEKAAAAKEAKEAEKEAEVAPSEKEAPEEIKAEAKEDEAQEAATDATASDAEAETK